ETGNAWLFGPDIDAYKLMTTTFGTLVYQPADLTVLAFVRNAIASYDLRCLSMPNQFDAYKMADALGVQKRRLTIALALAIVLAWAIKTLVLRYGGMRLYRQSLPFFYGMILGDFLAGGLTTLAGCIFGVNVYPINW